MREQKRIVDLPRAGFVASRVVGQLRVLDDVHMLRDRAREVPFHYLHVIDVILQPQVLGTDFLDDGKRLVSVAQIEARYVAGVDRLDQQHDTGVL